MAHKDNFDAPKNWTVDVREISLGQTRVVAVATDGRRIEMAGSDEERLLNEGRASIKEFETQPRYRKTGTEKA
jgi:hypothetical protein